jgi:methylmalonyl-CoA/ethylmalonyl-CoA epimerase
MKITAIGQISITAHDIDRATAFYRDVLQLKHLFSFPRMVFFECAGVRLMLAVPETPALDHRSSIIYFKVADIQASHAELLGRGVHFEAAPNMVARMESHELWLSEFRDSEDNILSLMSEVPLKSARSDSTSLPFL